jgi:hypothetical protein
MGNAYRNGQWPAEFLQALTALLPRGCIQSARAAVFVQLQASDYFCPQNNPFWVCFDWSRSAPRPRRMDEGPVDVTPTTIRPTPRGMFYADSIADQFAWRQTDARRDGQASAPLAAKPEDEEEGRPWGNDNGRGHM